MDAEISANRILQQRIINSLLLNASFIDNPGLMHGKMGISIYFYHLARQTQNKIYEDYAGELIDEIYEEITINTPAGFENGLAGIGWGIEYLVQNNFIKADTDEVLEEFDNRIFKELIYNTPQEIGLLNGIIGLGAYFLKRVQNPATDDEKIPTLTNKQCLIHLIDELDRKTQNITEIISEPPIFSINRETFKLSNNPQTFEQPSNNKPQTTNNKQKTTEQRTTNKIFDITWDYPVLLWFLAELYEQNIFNFKVEKIIQRLTEPLSNKLNLPELQSNRLLLALALTKLQQTTNSVSPGSASNRDHEQQIGAQWKSRSGGTTNNERQTTDEQSNPQTMFEQLSNLQTVITNLLDGINRNTINSELPQNNDTIRYDISGIAWVYRQLHHLTEDNHFKEEREYWLNRSFVVGKEDNFSGTGTDNKNVWGILEGVAGLLLIPEIIKETKT